MIKKNSPFWQKNVCSVSLFSTAFWVFHPFSPFASPLTLSTLPQLFHSHSLTDGQVMSFAFRRPIVWAPKTDLRAKNALLIQPRAEYRDITVQTHTQCLHTYLSWLSMNSFQCLMCQLLKILVPPFTQSNQNPLQERSSQPFSRASSRAQGWLSK